MNILCIGDVVGEEGLAFLCESLPIIKRKTQADFVIVNGENSDKSGCGLTRHGADRILQHADVITTGNHCYRKANEDLYLENETVLHPANFPFTETETGTCTIDMGRKGAVQVINLMGTAWLEAIDNPFICADKLLKSQKARYTIVDFHAESTAEKKALAFYLDGKISAFFGTHTHVQTADEQVLPKGTGYITDVGMVGAKQSVLGVLPELAIKKQRTHGAVRFEVAKGEQMLNGVLFTLNEQTGLCEKVERVYEDEKTIKNP